MGQEVEEEREEVSPEDVDVEVSRPKQVKTPKQPTPAELAEHEVLGHVQYREWCRHCVAARGIGQQHKSREQEEREADGLPVLSMDYAFMGQEDSKVRPILVCKDSKTQSYAATFVEKKGVDAYASKFLQSFAQHLGYKRMVWKSDGEAAIVALKAHAADGLKGVEVVMQESPPEDHKANGAAEKAVQEIKRQVRVIKSSLEEKLKEKLEENDSMLAWMPRHAADLLSRYRRGADGRTAEMRRSGKEWRRPGFEFGERLFFKEQDSSQSKNDLHMKMKEGRYVGHHGRTGTLLVMTAEGVRRALGARRLPDVEKWKFEGWRDLKGLPWEIRARRKSAAKADKEEAFMTEGPLVLAPPPAAPADEPAMAPAAHRRVYVLKADVERFGPTDGCPGCTCILVGDTTRLNHSEACRARMVELLEKDDKGKVRLDAHRLREGSSKSGPAGPGTPRAGVEEKGKKKVRIQDKPEVASPGRMTPHKREAETTLEDLKDQEVMEQNEALPPHLRVIEPSGSGSGPQGEKRPAETATEELDPRVGDVEDLVNSPTVEPSPEPASSLSARKAESLPVAQTFVRDRYRAQGVDITEEEVTAIASLCVELAAVDVMEIYSPKRFTEAAPRFGLKPGYAVDLCEQKPSGGFWDLSKEADVKELEQLVEEEEPYLLTGGPPCEAFSRLQGINKNRVPPEIRKQRREKGEKHLHLSIEMYRKQLKAGRYFLHEHPWSADSWFDEEVQKLSKEPGVFTVKGPMCRWEMEATDPRGLQGTGYVRKETGWMTNSPVLAEILEGVCTNETGGPWHRHVHLIGGIARGAAVYPPKLVSAVLKGLKRQMTENGHLSTLESHSSGPVPEEPLMEHGEWFNYWDDVNGGYLDPKGVEEARKLEMDYIHRQGVWKKVPMEQCLKETGKKPIPLRWIDTNKGDHDKPNLRSRLVVRDIKARKGPDEQLDPAVLFSAMPPIEGMRLLASLLVTRKKSKHGKALKLGSWDISRAHFYGTPKRNIFVQLPEEEGVDTTQECGLLCKSMYGTQDAPAIWQDHYSSVLKDAGWKRGKSNGAVFYHPELDANILVHGDDFLCLGDEDAQQKLDEVLRKAYELKKLGTLGFEEKDDKELSFLNRMIRVDQSSGADCVVLEPDGRHVDLLVKELGLGTGKGVDTPDVKKSVDVQLLESRSPPLPAEQVKQYRSLVMRAAYLGQDRADIGHAVKTLSRKMVQPLEADWQNLKRLGRYLKKHPYARLVFGPQKEPGKLKVQVDSDHAGDAVTRRSTTGMVVYHGRHPIKHSSNVQSTVALSTGESEFYALVKAGSTGLGIQSLMADWGIQSPLLVETDSSAAKGQSSRIGLGKSRHVQTRYMWIQERVNAKHMLIHKVPGEKNTSDILTKSTPGPTLRKHLKTMGYEFSESKCSGQKGLLT